MALFVTSPARFRADETQVSVVLPGRHRPSDGKETSGCGEAEAWRSSRGNNTLRYEDVGGGAEERRWVSTPHREPLCC